MANDNHTPISHLLPNENSQVMDPKSQQLQANIQHSKQAQISMNQSGKESEPMKVRSESLKSAEEAKDTEGASEEENKKDDVKQIRQIPNIPKDAEKAGLALAPSARPFPTIYDVKVPIYTDEQIEQNLHKSFWTGARWLAELCKYLLWQSHIKLKKIGNKVIRQIS